MRTCWVICFKYGNNRKLYYENAGNFPRLVEEPSAAMTFKSKLDCDQHIEFLKAKFKHVKSFPDVSSQPHGYT